MHKSSLTLFGALVALPMSFAALYPTFPVGSTVIPAGEDVVIRWKDDSNGPHLDKLGLLRVDLFLDNDSNLVSTLAKDIKPTERAAKIRIEKEFGADGSNYYIRFTPSQKGRTPIYTAKFTITGLTNELEVQNVSNSTATTVASSSTTASNLGIAAIPTATYSPPSLTWGMPTAGQETATMRPNNNGGSARFQRPADSGLGMMSFMYLMWPLVMGVAMAV